MDETYKFSNRRQFALFMACKTCQHSPGVPMLDYYLGNEPGPDGRDCKLNFDIKFDMVMDLRKQCKSYQVEEPIERDTTYPGATFAPWDHHDHLKDDSSDIDFNPDLPKRCLNQQQKFTPPKTERNNWEIALIPLFWRKNFDSSGNHIFPSNKEVMYLLATSKIPALTFRLGLKDKMRFDRGLWFFKSERYNLSLEKNKQIKEKMIKVIMVYLYYQWFKRIDDKLKEGFVMQLDICDDFTLGKDLAWWLRQVFKDKIALNTPRLNRFGDVIEDPEALEIEFVSLSLLDKARLAAELNESGCASHEELDKESIGYDRLLAEMGKAEYDPFLEEF